MGRAGADIDAAIALEAGNVEMERLRSGINDDIEEELVERKNASVQKQSAPVTRPANAATAATAAAG